MSLGAPLLVLLKGKAPEQEKKELSAKSYIPISNYHFGDIWIEYVIGGRDLVPLDFFFIPTA